MYDIRNFTLKDMVETSAALRRMGAEAASMEQVADRIVHYLYDQFVDRETGEKNFVQVRFFKTHPYAELDEEQRDFARGILGAPPGISRHEMSDPAGQCGRPPGVALQEILQRAQGHPFAQCAFRRAVPHGPATRAAIGAGGQHDTAA